MKSNLKIFCFSIFLFLLTFNVYGKIENSIVLKVGNHIITEGDLRNEILINLILNKKEITQNNINMNKNSALNALKNYYLKKNEVEKYNENRFNRDDLDSYLNKISNALNVQKSGLKTFFTKNDLNYELFEDRYKTNLLWNSVIFSLYKNQININMIEVDNELEKLTNIENKIKEYNISEIQLNISQENINELIKNIKKEIQDKGFNSAVTKFSTSPTKNNFGNLGWISEKSLSINYMKELKELEKGEISNAITDKDSIVFLKINDLRYNISKNPDLKKLKEQIINKKKSEKLNLFSRSHLATVENNTLIELNK